MGEEKELILKNKLGGITRIKVNAPTPEQEKSGEKEEAFYTQPSDDDDEKSAVSQIQEKAKEQINTLKIENSNLQKLSDHRIRYSWAIFIFVVIFMLCFITVVVLAGIKILCFSDSVMKVFLSTNTVQVVGILYIVAKWLYPTNGNSKK